MAETKVKIHKYHNNHSTASPGYLPPKMATGHSCFHVNIGTVLIIISCSCYVINLVRPYSLIITLISKLDNYMLRLPSGAWKAIRQLSTGLYANRLVFWQTFLTEYIFWKNTCLVLAWIWTLHLYILLLKEWKLLHNLSTVFLGVDTYWNNTLLRNLTNNRI